MLKDFDLVNISERNMTLLCPLSKEKIVKIGEVIHLEKTKHVLDLACGFGEVLAQWGNIFGITGTGIDIRDFACDKAKKRIDDLNVSEQIKIYCQPAKDAMVKEPVDVISIFGASFIFGGFKNTLRTVKSMLKPNGKVVIGEPYLLKDATSNAMHAFIKKEGLLKETALLTIIQEENYTLEYILHSSHDEWDRYISENWLGLSSWLKENKGHPNWEEVKNALHTKQADYLGFGHEYMGWAVYILQNNVE